MDLFFQILFIILAYLIGSVPFGFIFGICHKVDLRKVGSGNIGATNCGRILGKKYAVFTYILDMIKGALFVVLFRFGILKEEWCVLSPMLYGLVATLGHTFPVYLGFKGGKSVSCGSGAVFGYCPFLALFLIIVFLIVKKISKLVSVSSLISVIICMISIILISVCSGQFLLSAPEGDIIFWPYNYWFVIFSFIIGLIIYIRHTSNIKNILNHTEKPINY